MKTTDLFSKEDLMLQIVSQMDNYSVIEHLNAFPELKEQTAVLTDHDLPLMFFDVPGVRRKYLPSKQFMTNSPQDDEPHRFEAEKIKLIELVHRENIENFLKETAYENLNKDQTVQFNETTFIFIRYSHSQGMPQACSELERRLDQYTNCKWTIGSSTRFSEDTNTELLARQGKSFNPQNMTQCATKGQVITKSLSPDLDLTKLQTLRIEGVHTLENITLPNVVELSIVYPHQTGKRPVITNLAAPMLAYFVIHYNGLVPKIQRLTVGQDSKLPRGVRTFELADIRGIQGNRSTYMTTFGDEAVDLKSLREILDLKFASTFPRINLIGVPINVMFCIDFKHIRSLRWQASIGQDADSFPFIQMPRLEVFSSTVLAPDTKFLKFATPKIKQIYLNLLSPRVNISPYWNTLSKKYATEVLIIYRSLSLLKGKDSEYKSIILDDEWSKLAEYSGQLKTLKLIGFEMPFLTLSKPNDPEALRFSMKSCDKIVLRPVIKPKPEEVDRDVSSTEYQFLETNTPPRGQSWHWYTIDAIKEANNLTVSPIPIIEDPVTDHQDRFFLNFICFGLDPEKGFNMCTSSLKNVFFNDMRLKQVWMNQKHWNERASLAFKLMDDTDRVKVLEQRWKIRQGDRPGRFEIQYVPSCSFGKDATVYTVE